MNPRNSWPAVVLAAAAMAAGGGMAIAGVEKDTILLVLGVLATPVITALVAAQGAQTASKVDAVQQQTNGHQSRLLDIIAAQSKLLAAQTPATAGNQAVVDQVDEAAAAASGPWWPADQPPGGTPWPQPTT
jgi:hypothetical protein